MFILSLREEKDRVSIMVTELSSGINLIEFQVLVGKGSSIEGTRPP